jgi:hypothetical protein
LRSGSQPAADELGMAIDLLMERSPRFRAECQEIRERMNSGQFHAHEDVRKLLLGE